MPTRGDNGHSHELDYAFKAVGYELTNMVEAVEQMDWFERRIDDFDLVYCPPLSAFVRNEENSMRWAPVPFDLRKHAPTIARWIQAGGVLTMVDVNDPDMLAWLDAMDPKMAATTESCSFPPAVLMEPTGPVLFLPRRAEFGCEWGDLSSETNVLLRGVSVCDGASDGETPPPSNTATLSSVARWSDARFPETAANLAAERRIRRSSIARSFAMRRRRTVAARRTWE